MQKKVNLAFNEDSTKALLSGVKKLAFAVRTTMGPGGSNVLIQTENRPILTKDGVTVARAINLTDKLENLGAQLVKEAAAGAADIAGDGTTTATVLTYAVSPDRTHCFYNKLTNFFFAVCTKCTNLHYLFFRLYWNCFFI